jgi:hypothetical protein
MRVASKNRTGVSSISETIRGDDITDWARFRVNVPVQVNLVADNAIAAIVNSSYRVGVDSSDGYSSNLTATLQPESAFSCSAPSLLLPLCLPRS